MDRFLKKALSISIVSASGLLAVGAPAVAAQGERFQIEEVVVTARKRSESVMDVPLAISALNEEFLERGGIEGIEDIAASTPGLTFQSFKGGGLASPVIRGLAQTTVSSADNNVGVFLDGAFINGKSNIDIGLLDIERVEVVKGPQSAMFGRNSFAGAINYVTKKPGDHLEGKLSASAGSDEYMEVKGSVRGPIIPGILGGSLSLSTSEFDGTLENGFGGENLGGWDSKRNGAVDLVYTPTDRLIVDFFYYYGESKLDPTAAYIADNNCGASVVTAFPRRGGDGGTYYCGELDAKDEYYVSRYARDSEFETEKTTLQVTYDFDAMSLTFLSSFGDYDFDALEDQIYDDSDDNPTTRRFNIPFVGPAEDESYELRLQSTDASDLQWLVGAYVFEGEFYQYAESFSAMNPLSSGSGLLLRDKLETSEVQSLFGSLEYAFTDRLTAGLELRYTEEEKRQDDYAAGLELEEKFSFVTPRLNVTWALSDTGNVYASYAKGVKSGGFNATTYVPEQAYDEETIDMYELGYKGLMFDGRMNINAAMFYFIWDDLQFTGPTHEPGGRTNVTQNIGEADGWGAELEVSGMLSSQLEYRFGVAWTKPEFEDGTVDVGSDRNCPDASLPVSGCSTDVGGNPVPRQSEWQLNLGGTWYFNSFGQEFYLRGDLNHESEKYARPLAVLSYGERTVLNARLGWENASWDVSLWGKNITDEEYIRSTVNEPEFGGFIDTGSTATSSTFTTALPANGASYGVSAIYRF